MNAFVLKLIACITMFIDHIGYAIFGTHSYFNYIGRLAFPIFAFQISEGYVHTKNLKKYFLRLFVFALISQIPFMLFTKLIFNEFSINVIFTLLFGLMSITIYDKVNKFVGIVVTVLLGIIAEKCAFDYGFFGVAIVPIFYMFRNKKVLLAMAFSLACILKYLIPVAKIGLESLLYIFSNFNSITLSLIFTILSLVVILNYNGKKGKNTKYLLYFFYPIHLLIISIFLLV